MPSASVRILTSSTSTTTCNWLARRFLVTARRFASRPLSFAIRPKLASNVAAMKAAGQKPATCMLEAVTESIEELSKACKDLCDARETHVHGLAAEAKHYCDEVLPAMLEVRKAADALEAIVANDLWPLPTYEEMLFISK